MRWQRSDRTAGGGGPISSWSATEAWREQLALTLLSWRRPHPPTGTPNERARAQSLSGIGLLDMAFEDEGFTVVRGPDLLWGGDVKRFHAPSGHFVGVIGGPPCQAFCRLVHIV